MTEDRPLDHPREDETPRDGEPVPSEVAPPTWRGRLAGRFRRDHPEPARTEPEADGVPTAPTSDVEPVADAPQPADTVKTYPAAGGARNVESSVHEAAEPRPAPPATPTPPPATSRPNPLDPADLDPADLDPADLDPVTIDPTTPAPAIERTEARSPRGLPRPGVAPTSPGGVGPLPPPVPPGASPDADEYLDLDDETTEGTLPESPRLAPRQTAISPHLVVLTALATAVIMTFLLVEPSPRWFLVIGAILVVFATDGTLRETWREPFALGQETAPFLFVPALYVLAVPVLIEHNITGELVVLAGLGAGAGFGALAWAELASVRAHGAEYPRARIIVTANTYLAGFAVFSLTYVFGVSLPVAILATGIAATMLAVEVLREGEIDPVETLGFALITGVVLAEARWLFYYLPLDTYLAGLALVLVFYLVTGLLHSHIVRALTRGIAVEYGAIAAAGFVLVILARVGGLA